MARLTPVELTDAQIFALTMLTEQRGANLLQLADLIGDMNAEGLEFLRGLGDPRREALTHFLSRAEPETLTFLARATAEEVKNLREGLKLVVAIQLLGRVGKWSVATAFAAFVGGVLVWEKVASWFKAR